jgi:hypothetical protein
LHLPRSNKVHLEAEWLARVDFCQALLIANEFVYVE